MIYGIVLPLILSVTPLKVMLDWFPNADHVPLYVAQQKGFFEDAGLQVEFQVPTNPSDPLKLTASGKVDIAINYEPEVVIARSEGLDVISIGILVEHPLTTILFLKNSEIQTPKDLEGKRIGFAVPHLQEILFKAFADYHGLRNYKLINIGFNITPSLLTHKVDAVIGAYRNYEKNELELEGQPAGFFALEENGIPDYYELVFITNSKVLSKKKEALKAFLQAVQRAIDFCRHHPNEALKLYFQANPDVRKDLDRKAFEDTLPFYAHTQIQKDKMWENFIEFAVRYKLVDTHPQEPLFVNLVGE